MNGGIAFVTYLSVRVGIKLLTFHLRQRRSEKIAVVTTLSKLQGEK